MKNAFKNAWKWILVGLLGLLGFSSCEKPQPDMYGPLPNPLLMYGPMPASYETCAPQDNPEEVHSETVTPVVESLENQ